MERKNVIFGSFSDVAEGGAAKRRAWTEIQLIMESNGVNRSVEYFRDSYWKNNRLTTMKKVDNGRKTGTGGGPNSKETEVDELVLQIIGKDSPAVVGLPVEESQPVADANDPINSSVDSFQSADESHPYFTCFALRPVKIAHSLGARRM
jgi:hypothetical protein